MRQKNAARNIGRVAAVVAGAAGWLVACASVTVVPIDRDLEDATTAPGADADADAD